MAVAEMKTTALFQWFGSNRNLASEVGRELAGCSWVAIPFAGGMCEVPHIKARTIIVNDLHRAAINCASVAADPVLGPMLYRRLRRIPFHPTAIESAQERCRLSNAAIDGKLFPNDDVDRLGWAMDYFTIVWMGRGGDAGTPREFSGGLSVRWDSGGGDSAVRFRSAAESLIAWRRSLSRCTFQSMDAIEMIGKVKDQKEHGIFCDPPFPGPGDGYTHQFTAANHRTLAAALGEFTETRCVCRFYDHPLVRELYPEPQWTWRRLVGGKDRMNEPKPEVLLINGRAA